MTKRAKLARSIDKKFFNMKKQKKKTERLFEKIVGRKVINRKLPNSIRN